jgi:hypothetical protein
MYLLVATFTLHSWSAETSSSMQFESVNSYLLFYMLHFETNHVWQICLEMRIASYLTRKWYLLLVPVQPSESRRPE